MPQKLKKSQLAAQILQQRVNILAMELFEHFPIHARQKIRYVLADIDDTLTFKGRLPAVVFAAMERLQRSEIAIVPITGRPAGWCDHMARMWPVNAIVGTLRELAYSQALITLGELPLELTRSTASFGSR